MKKEFKIDLGRFDSLNDYNALEEAAKDAAFDYSISLSIKHLFRDYKAIWTMNGEESDIDNFLCFLDL